MRWLALGLGLAATVTVRCRRTCTARHVADGPTAAHAEGHIIFLRSAVTFPR